MSARTAPRTSSSWTTSSTASRSPCRKLPIIHGACDMRRIPLMLAATLLAGCGGVTSPGGGGHPVGGGQDRKSTRLNSSHLVISYAVFCLKKKKKKYHVRKRMYDYAH